MCILYSIVILQNTATRLNRYANLYWSIYWWCRLYKCISTWLYISQRYWQTHFINCNLLTFLFKIKYYLYIMYMHTLLCARCKITYVCSYIVPIVILPYRCTSYIPDVLYLWFGPTHWWCFFFAEFYYHHSPQIHH